MYSSTPWLLVLSLLFICSVLPIQADHNPTECSLVEWQVDWDDVPESVDMESFQNPGEIIDGVIVSDVLELLGLAWNAHSWQEIAGLVCVKYGPLLNELAEDESVMRECDFILGSLRRKQRSSVYEACIRASEEMGAGNYSTSPLQMYSTGDSTLDDLETINNLSPIAFELLEWLGPSPFSLDFHGGCSALRILLSMPVQAIIDRVKNICVYPLAVVLESYQSNNVCGDLIPGSDDAFIVDILDDLLDPLDVAFCQFLSRDPTHDAFIDRATTIIDNAEAFLTDTNICEEVLTTWDEYVAPDDESIFRMTFNLITGANLSSSLSRRMLCNQISEAFSPDSSYVPTPYVLPDDFSPVPGESVPGESLPGFFFQDQLNIAGAFLRSSTLAGGIVVYCDVFETLFIEELPDNAFDIMEACGALRDRDLARVEDTCLDVAYQPRPTYNDLTIPLSVRMFTPYYLGAIGLEFYRQLFGLMRISQEDTCRAFDNFYQSDNNLQSLTRLAVDVWLAEVIPMAHMVCSDYRAFYEYYDRRQSADDFPVIEERIMAFILAHLSFSTRLEVCRVIAQGIDPLSGRATDAVVRRFEQEILAFLTDERRCVASADAFLMGLEVGYMDATNAMFQLHTGYNSTNEACSELKEYFSAELCGSEDDIPEDETPETTARYYGLIHFC